MGYQYTTGLCGFEDEVAVQVLDWFEHVHDGELLGLLDAASTRYVHGQRCVVLPNLRPPGVPRHAWRPAQPEHTRSFSSFCYVFVCYVRFWLRKPTWENTKNAQRVKSTIIVPSRFLAPSCVRWFLSRNAKQERPQHKRENDRHMTAFVGFLHATKIDGDSRRHIYIYNNHYRWNSEPAVCLY